ncbi:MAG: hypothetical protein ACLPH3_25985 [Terracidiphilus sp.]
MSTPATKTCRWGPRFGLSSTRTRPSVKLAAGGPVGKSLACPEQLFWMVPAAVHPNVFGFALPADDYHPDLVGLDGFVVRRRPLN